METTIIFCSIDIDMTTTFRKYESITPVYRKTEHQELLVDDIWVCTEKLHGANFSVTVTPDGSTRWARRNGFLSPDEYKGFYHADLAIDQYEQDVLVLASRLGRTLTLYGELVGGTYPKLESNDGAKPVQKGVFYTPTIEWVVFDVFDHELDRYWTSEECLENLCDDQDMCGLHYTPVLYRGTFGECMAWSALHYSDESEIGERLFGLPHVSNNMREGHVIKVDSITGCAARSTNEWYTLKHKNTKFIEKSQRTKSKSKPNVSPKTQSLIDEALSYVTVQRLDNVLSKTGPCTRKDIGRVIGLFRDDALTDFVKDAVSPLSSQDLSVVRKHVQAAVQPIVVSELSDR